MKKFRLPITLILFFFTSFLSAVSGNPGESNVSIPQGVTYEGSILSFKGELDVKGRVADSILLMGGRLTLDGEVENDVICINSTVKLGSKAMIKKDLYVIGGSLEKESGARISGEVFHFKLDLKRIENSLLPVLSDSGSLSLFKIIKVVLWFVITLLVFAVVPHRIYKAEEYFDGHHLKIGVIGVIGLLTFVFLLFVAILLSFIFIGFPLLLALIILYIVVFVFGRTVMFYHIGSKLNGLLKIKTNIAPAIFILTGAIFYALLKFVPLVGAIILITINIFELGIGAGYFFRKRLKLTGL